MPFVDELLHLPTPVIFRCHIGDSQALPLDNAEPWFDGIHPRTMHRYAVHGKMRPVG
jgi:hypothetical protein